ncbi:M20/M25/M40 family metallo-hydrolase [Pseudooceanicola sp. CBS1P-1]|uniref:M20/M25/M40 family metallo-hydrolase n=1 Tax=Pseudooceanicola albus TaxID=2692189 RepID=A0A6L7G7F7_9RHOB|nr:MULTISPECIES: M20/M25/M40 family metallo-hydrolase [Pseudooceanicola]MBT9385977.1 M20/M25/M40 family metallo-hydrolase [Pseudooceanicola endophyticus]MXN19602.1 M20/M25/M40 family metallo-hydrolase [Pseudooceanicola albus]
MTDFPLPDSPRLRAALDHLATNHDHFVDEIVALTQIPAPPFQEAERAAAMAARFRALGLTPEIDAEGNVTALRRGTGAPDGPVIVAAAHLDTVFPAGTDVTVRREGTRLFAPGIGDDTRGLAALLAFLGALQAGGVDTRQDILFVADVGEEGLGDLRGIRHLFTKGPWAGRIAAFFTFDGIETADLTIGAVGSLRSRVVLRGPGGHSLSNFGRVNPAYALGRVLDGISRLSAPPSPRSTWCASTLSGGTGINAIPAEVSLGVDLRSESAEILADLEAQLRTLVDEAVAAENARGDTAAGAVTAEILPLGHRPAGATPETAEIVLASLAAIRSEGFTPRMDTSSTDANIPMSLGIPAVKFSHGGSGDRAHTLEEWIDVEPTLSLRGLRAGLKALVAVAGLAEG